MLLRHIRGELGNDHLFGSAESNGDLDLQWSDGPERLPRVSAGENKGETVDSEHSEVFKEFCCKWVAGKSDLGTDLL